MRAIRLCASLAVWPLLAALFVAPVYGADGLDQKMFEQKRLVQLLAPIALYPDDLLDNILLAATYPLEVSQAARLMQANRNLSGPALASALGEQTWDQSVKSLVSFPAILRRMNERIDWTQELGDAFLVQRADVMETVQTLRQKPESPTRWDGPIGQANVAGPRPLHGPSYSISIATGQFGPGPAAPTPVLVAYSNVGTASSAVERARVATVWDRPRSRWSAYGPPVSYVLPGPPAQGSLARGGYVRQVPYGGPKGLRAGGFGAVANFRGRPIARAATARRASWRR